MFVWLYILFCIARLLCCICLHTVLTVYTIGAQHKIQRCSALIMRRHRLVVYSLCCGIVLILHSVLGKVLVLQPLNVAEEIMVNGLHEAYAVHDIQEETPRPERLFGCHRQSFGACCMLRYPLYTQFGSGVQSGPGVFQSHTLGCEEEVLRLSWSRILLQPWAIAHSGAILMTSLPLASNLTP